MPKHVTRGRLAIIAMLLIGLLGSAAPAGASQGGTKVKVREIATGFVGPLGLAVHGGTIYVAEAFAGRLTTFKERKPDQRTTAYQLQGEGFLPGVAVGGSKHRVVFTASQEDGTLNKLGRNGSATMLASLKSYEAANNPDAGQTYGFLELSDECRGQLPEFLQQPYGGIVDSNPYGVAIDKKGNYLVADAAGNTIVKVSHRGKEVSTVAVLPPVEQVITQDVIDAMAANPEFPIELPPCALGATYTGEFVPTDIEIGPDGHYYVTSLPGMPEAPGAGSVWKIHRSKGTAQMIASGFSGAVDLAVARDGTIYVAELFAGQISKVSRRGKVSTWVTLDSPGAVEITRGGTLYATTGVFAETGGSVVKLTVKR
jgi:hypothetical protein